MARYVTAPHSPTSLRYPPSPYYREWWGRCFRCARKGHINADCKHPRAVFTPTTGDSQEAQPRLTQSRQDNTPPPQGEIPPPKGALEPSFDDLLVDPEPQGRPNLPPDMPQKIHCFFNKDEHYNQALQKFLTGIVLQPPANLAGKFTLDQAADTIATSTKVAPPQLQVASLAHGRFLVLLPPQTNRHDVVASIPNSVWNEGFTFHTYSPLADASISIPFFKLWIDIVGVPPGLYSDTHMARAVSSFATDDLALIPHKIEFKVGGMVYTTTVRPRKFIKGPVYRHIDLPPATTPLQPPPSPPALQTNPPILDPYWFSEDDVIPTSLKALKEIFRDFDPSQLPADLAACLAGDREAIAANHNAYREWEKIDCARRGVQYIPRRPRHPIPPVVQTVASPSPMAHDTPTSSQPVLADSPTLPHLTPPQPATSFHATPDQTHIPFATPIATQQPSPPTPPHPRLPADHAQPSLDNTQTVHRTYLHTLRDSPHQPDLSLQVCTNLNNLGQTDRPRALWEPQHLFPELCTIPP